MNPAGDTADEDRESLAASQQETRAAFENRALVYAYIYAELAEEVGEVRAAEIMGRAIRRRGLEIGEKYRSAGAARDLVEVARVFCEGSPAGGSLFQPGVEEDAVDGRVVLRMTSCPLVEAWEAAGYDADQVDRLCEIAAEVDHGTFESAGLELTFLDRKGIPGSSRCLLELRVPGATPAENAVPESDGPGPSDDDTAQG